MDNFVFAVNAVGPILILIGLGYFLKKINFIDEHFLQLGNKFVFRIALPVLLFKTIYDIQSFSQINWSIVIYAVCAVLFLFIFGLVLSFTLIKDPKQKGVIIQGVFRANYVIIGLPLAEAIGGQAALGVFAIVAAFIVPLMNILSVVALVIFVKDETGDIKPFRAIIRKVFENPLIIAIFIGLASLGIRALIPIDPITGSHVFSLSQNIPLIYTAIQWISRLASPLALIVLGGTFEFFVIKSLAREISIGVISRLIVGPIIVLGLAVLLTLKTDIINFTSNEFSALIALVASPTAVSSAIMAREMHNDEKLAVQLVVWTTTLSIVSIFLTVVIFKVLNFI